MTQLDTIPGISERVAEVVVAEVGTDMTRFQSAAHRTSWGGMCPGSNESAGKRRTARTRKGSPTLRRTLTEAGQAAGRSKNTYLGTVYRRIATRRGRKKAAIAAGRRILEIAYYVLRDGVAYQELGANYYDEHKKDAVVRNAVKRLPSPACPATRRRRRASARTMTPAALNATPMSEMTAGSIGANSTSRLDAQLHTKSAILVRRVILRLGAGLCLVGLWCYGLS